MWRDDILTPDTLAALATAGMVESLLGGVTTVADQHYFFPGPGPTIPYIEATIEAAKEIGIRFNAGRGTITLGERHGGGAPDIAVQTVDEVVRHADQLVAAYHDPEPFAQVRIDLAPCGVHADVPELFTEFAAMAARTPAVGLHTHLYETIDTKFAQDRYGETPWQILLKHGWHHDRVWLAHMNDPPAEEIPEYAAAGVGVVHLIGPDLKLGWGLAPLRQYLESGVTVGFGTTGSASNDGANVLGDLRVAALAHRSGSPDPMQWPTARELLRMATRGSARCINRPELGVLAKGFGADIACWDLTSVDRVGVRDPVAGLLHTGLSDRASLVMVDGEIVVQDGQCLVADERRVADNAWAHLRGEHRGASSFGRASVKREVLPELPVGDGGREAAPLGSLHGDEVGDEVGAQGLD